ncbi:MAG: hypothetical protein K8T89_20970 [Planctomycetes bacterium]|nr:hypothetical protein [Planctomycetota bacterium]
MAKLSIVKVGGSLFDHPALGPTLRNWLEKRTGQRHVLVAGGGAAANVIRQYHHTHHLPEPVSHWLAIQMMDVNGAFLRHLVNGSAEILNAREFCERDEGKPGALAHDWRVTSDAIAARAAEVLGASELVMLKSVALPAGISWAEAAAKGLVDHAFGEVVERAGIRVEWVNLRDEISEEP